MRIKALVEKGNDGMYSISSEEAIGGNWICGYGNTIEDAKEDFILCAKEMLESDLDNSVEYVYDVPSFFGILNCINVSAFAKKAGINESKMRAYKNGLAKASEATLNKIRNTAAQLGQELISASLH